MSQTKTKLKALTFGVSALALVSAVSMVLTEPVEKRIAQTDVELYSVEDHVPEQSNASTSRLSASESLVISEEELTTDQHGAVYRANAFANMQEYEAASRFGMLPSNMRDVLLQQFEYDEQGNFVLSRKVKSIAEFFLLAVDAEGYEQAVARLEEYIELTLPVSAQDEALAVVRSYLNYKQNMQDRSFPMTADLSDVDTLKEIRHALDERKKVRREYMGNEVSDALFGHEERYDDYSLTRVEINGNLALSPDEKDQLLAQAEKSLPEKVAKKMRYKREQKKVQTQIKALQETAGNEDKIYQIRKDFYGEAVADRYAYLEDNSPEWKNRVDAYHRDQQQILNDSSLSQEERTERIQALKQDSFTKQERVKLAVQSVRAMI